MAIFSILILIWIVQRIPFNEKEKKLFFRKNRWYMKQHITLILFNIFLAFSRKKFSEVQKKIVHIQMYNYHS